MRVLAIAGVAALVFTMPLTLAVVALLIIVVTSYQQTIRAYPKGGGLHRRQREPGHRARPGGGGVDPDRLRADGGRLGQRRRRRPYFRLPRAVREPGLVRLAAVAVDRLGQPARRAGVRDAVRRPGVPLLGSILGLLAFGFFRFATGDVPAYTPPPDDPAHPTGCRSWGCS